MRGYNRVVIAGNIVRDPEFRYTISKRAYLRFTVAVNNRYKNQNGEIQEATDYIPVVVWGAPAETAAKFLKKGSPVLVEGKLRTGSYEKDGIKRYTTDVSADNIIFLSQNSNNGDYNSQGYNRNNNSNMQNPAPYVSPMPGGDLGSINDKGFVDDFNFTGQNNSQDFGVSFDDGNPDDVIPF